MPTLERLRNACLALAARGPAGITKLHAGAGLAAVASLATAAAMASAAADEQHIRISQKNQAFKPNELSIPRGTTLDFVNDDGDVLHHAYVDSPSFSFDSGDQEPGSTAPVVFKTAGNFTVLCGIHPKMKLKVHVQ